MEECVMKKIFYIISTAAALVLAAGCSKEMTQGAPEVADTDAFTLKVNVQGTKTSFDGDTYAVEWESDDVLGVYIVSGESGDLYRFDKATGENAFSCQDFTPEEGVDYTYYVLYPYDSDFAVTDGKSTDVVKIATGTQTAAGSSDHIETPLYGMASATGAASPEVSLNHLASVVKVNVTNSTSSDVDILNVSLVSSDLALSGTYSVDFSTGKLTAAATSNTSSVEVTDGSLAASATGTYFIACAPFTSGSFTVSVNDGEVTSEKSGLTFDAGKVYRTSLTISEFVLSGSALPADANAQLTQTLENENVYAWRAELQAGELYISAPGGYIASQDKYFTELYTYTISENPEGTQWSIPSDGIYRIIVDTANNTILIYDPENDLKNTVVSYNNTVDGINPYEQEVTELWMYGGFNSYSTGTDCFVGLDPEYTLKQSLADPNVFVYYGDVLPRHGGSDANNDGTYKTGFINFKVSNIHNNVYCYGSTADAKRNEYSGYIENINPGESLKLVAGQGHNRYAYFIIPSNVNYIEINIEELTVVFDNR